MADVLKGNFKPRKQVTVADQTDDDPSTRFEREALKRLGGSIAFVAKRKFIYDGKAEGRSPEK
jgi:hypothetical protein